MKQHYPSFLGMNNGFIYTDHARGYKCMGPKLHFWVANREITTIWCFRCYEQNYPRLDVTCKVCGWSRLPPIPLPILAPL